MTLTREHLRSDTTAPVMAKRVRVLALLLGVFGATVSMLGSWIPSLWGDEAASVLSANRSIPSLFAMLGHVDAVHGTYYLGLHFWVGLFGSSAFSVRLPSALAVGVCVAGVFLIATKLDSTKLGVVAAVICAILPRVTVMGDEARSYAFSAAIATWLTLLLIDMMQRSRPRRAQWVAYGLLLAVGIYTFLYLVLLAVAHAVILVSNSRSRHMVRSWLRVILAVGIATLPLLVMSMLQRSQISFLSHRATADFYSLAVTLWFGTPVIAVLCWSAIAAAIGFFLYDLRKARFVAYPDRTPTQSLTFVAAVWLFVPSGLLYLSHFLVPDFTARYLSMCAPAAAMLIALGIVRIAQFKTIPILLAGAIILTAVIPDFVDQRSPYGKDNSDWSVVSAEIAANALPGDAIAFDEAVRPSRRPRLAMRMYPAGFSSLKDVTLKTPYFTGVDWHDTDYSIADANALGRLAGVNSIWLIDYATPTHRDIAGTADLRALGFTQTFTIDNHRSIVRHYSR